MSSKICNYCKRVRPLSGFAKNRAKCKSCRSLDAKVWQKTNTQKHNEYQTRYKAKQYHNDINFKIKHVLRARLRRALKNNWKSGSAVDNLGCSVKEFKLHIEAQFKPGMSWDNWSVNGWHIDHIKPLDAFDLTALSELQAACHYTNLQPMWGIDNSSKSNKELS